MKVKWLEKYPVLLGLIAIYMVLGYFIITSQYSYITNYQYSRLGENALNLAEVTAKALRITNADVEELESLTFKQLQDNELNNQLQELFELAEKNDSIKYVYLLREVSGDQVKYEVEESDTEFYELPTGTKLNYVWLLDVVIDEQERIEVQNSPEYFKDKNRYTAIDGELKQIFDDEETKHLITEGEWGTQITGVAPIYTQEGEYIGLIGVDMHSESFFKYRASIFYALVTLLLIPTIVMTAMFVYLHMSYRKKMNALAFKDQLTNVYNRRYFDIEGDKIFQNAFRNKTPVGVIIGDIDDFKKFNDKYGHQEGDIALQLVAEVMQGFVGKGAGFVARYGGEEFVVVLDNPQDIEKVSHDICTNIAQKRVEHTDGTYTHVTISLGVHSKIPDNSDDLDQFLKKSDDALYKAKEDGKNRFVIA